MPKILKIEGSDPSGKSGIPAAVPPMANYPHPTQGIHVTGSGFADGMVFVVTGPKPDAQGQAVPGETANYGYHWPAVGQVDDKGCNVDMYLPIRGPYQALAIVGTEVSEWFSFQVK